MLGLGLATSKGGFVDALAEVTNTKSIDFDGTNDILTLPASSSLGNANLSISAWFKTTSSDRIYLFQLIRSGSTTSTSVAISINQKASDQSDVAGYITGIVYGSSHGYFGSSSPVNANDGNWHHIVLTITDGSQKMYLDSQEIASGTLSYTASFSDSAGNIGNDASNSYEILGNVDEVAIWHDILTQNEVTQIYNTNKATLDLSTDTGDYSSSANLKGWWRMGDEASTRVVDDNANNLVIPDMRKTFFTGKSIDFDGTDDFIEVGDAQLMTTAGTVSAWIFVKSGTTVQSIVNKYNAGTGNREFRLTIESDEKPKWNVQSAKGSFDSNTTTKSGTALSTNTWNHIVGTFSANNPPKLYVNGSLVATASSNIDADGIDNGNSPIFFGRGINNTSVTDKVNTGTKITDVAIWNAELDANTIASIYNSAEPNNLTLSASYTAGSGVEKTGNLQAYYRMGNGGIDAFSNSSQTGIGLIADYTDATLGTALVPNLSDDGNGDGSNWTLTTLAEWTINTNTATAFEATTDSDIDGTADAKLYVKTSNSGLSADIPAGVYKITGTLSTTSTLPSSNCRFVWYGGYATNIHNLSAGNFEIYELCTSSSANHHFQFQTSTEGHNFKLENVKFEPVNGNAGITINMSAFDLVDHAPNRNSGDMINFDATADIETDTPTQIYTVANTKSVLFDGGDDFINAGKMSFLNGLSALSVSLWAKADVVSTNIGLFSIFDDTNDQISIKLTASNRLYSDFESSSNNGFVMSDSTYPTDKAWHHIVLVFDGSQSTNDDRLTFYVDGLEIASTTGGTAIASTISDFSNIEVHIGKVRTEEWNGNIDEVAIWDTALSASQVAQIYHGSKANFDLSQNGGGYTSASNLQAWWRMGDGILDDNNIAGNGLIGDQTNPTLATAITPHLNDDGNFNGNNWSTVAGDTGDWTGHTSSQTSMTLTKNGTDTGDLRLNLQSSINSGMSSDLESNAIYKFVYSVSTTSSLPSFQFRINHGGGTTTNLVAGTDNVIYFKVESASVYIQVRSNTDGQNFTLSNISLEKVNGNAGVMINMPNNAIETDTP